MPKLHLRAGLTIIGLVAITFLLWTSIDNTAWTHTDNALRGIVNKVTQATQVDQVPQLSFNDIKQDVEAAWELARATQHAGTGARVVRFLDKARRGEPFTVAAIGGSVSKGRGLVHPDHYDGNGTPTLYSPENMHVRIFEWLNATFPHSHNRFVNGAQGGTGAGYFAWCFNEHIPADPDLVLLELGVNDLNDISVIPKYEHLVRSVLELDSEPALINIESFTTLFPSLMSSSAFHGDVLAYYDVPSVSIRDVLLPSIQASPETEMPKWFRTGSDVTLDDPKVRSWGGIPVDMLHISPKGHELAANLVTSYLTTQLSSKPTPKRISFPATPLTHEFESGAFARRVPVCRSMNSPLPHPIPGDEPDAPGLHPIKNKGWSEWAWDEKRYLVARDVGATVVFDFVVADLETPSTPIRRGRLTRNPHNDVGTVAVGYQRSAAFGLGSVLCWVDDHRDSGKRLDGHWDVLARNMGIVDEVATGLEPGPHTLSCEVLRETLDPKGRTEFRIFAVMHD